MNKPAPAVRAPLVGAPPDSSLSPDYTAAAGAPKGKASLCPECAGRGSILDPDKPGHRNICRACNGTGLTLTPPPQVRPSS